MDRTIESVNQLMSDTSTASPNEQGTLTSGPQMESLEFPVKDEDLIALAREWKNKWESSDKKQLWEKTAKENEDYWRGKQHHSPLDERPLQDNVIFESLETALPLMTRRNPEPSVELARGEQETPEVLQFVEELEKELIDIADVQKLRLKVKKAARFWAIHKLGVVKLGWDLDRDMPTVKVVRPQKLILDPDATIDEDGYTGDYLGEVRQMSARKLVQMGIQNADYVNAKVNQKMGTTVDFTEYWTPEYFCWILDDKVLLKKKNPHWNYDSVSAVPQVDDMGNQLPPMPREVPGVNHFPSPRIPYVFLSIFNLGSQPMDDTSLIEQNLSQQDKLNKRERQIDANADTMNNGLIVSLSRAGMTKEQAAQLSKALRSGGVGAIPDGDPNAAVAKFKADSLPADLYNEKADTRNRIRDVFGVSGSTAAGVQQEKTVRGKILNRGLDTDRIGGGITEYLEQFADDIYNYWVQMLWVYKYPGTPLPKVVVSITEGSMLPKDNVTQANQAMELWAGGALDPITLFEKLEYPNPQETAKKLYLWLRAPEMLFQDDPEVQMVAQMQAMQAQAQMQQEQMKSGGGPPQRSGDILNQVPIESNAVPQ